MRSPGSGELAAPHSQERMSRVGVHNLHDFIFNLDVSAIQIPGWRAQFDHLTILSGSFAQNGHHLFDDHSLLKVVRHDHCLHVRFPEEI